MASSTQMSAASDSDMEGLKRLAELLLRQGKADLIGVRRVITAKADWGRELWQ